MSTRIRVRRDTAANWTSANPILGLGEWGVETNLLPAGVKAKIGDGVTRWNSLGYAIDTSGGGGVAWGTIGGTLTDQADLVAALTAVQGAAEANAATDATTKANAAQAAAIAAAATDATTKANAAQAAAVQRANHTGTQDISTVSGLQAALDGKEATQTAASQAEAEAGTGTSILSWTPQRIWQAIAAKLTSGTWISGAPGKATPVDADTLPLADSAAGNALKSLTWANLKATLKAALEAGAIFRTGVIDSAITGHVTDHSPTGFATASRVRMTSNGCYLVRSLGAGTDGRIVSFFNGNTVASRDDLLFCNEDTTGTTAAQRMQIRRDLILPPQCSVTFIYDGSLSRWVLLHEPPRRRINIATGDTTLPSGGAITNIDGCYFKGINGKRYAYKITPSYTTPAATTGIFMSVTGPTAHEMPYWTETMNTTNTGAHAPGGEVDAWDSGNETSATPNIVGGDFTRRFRARVEGEITCTADGNIQARGAAEAAAATTAVAKAGSFIEYECLSG